MNVIGHRGASRYAPENTFASFDLALAQAADGIETDVRMTKDGHLVLLHDETVDRTTNGKGAISSLLWKNVKDFDTGSWFDPHFKNERIPLLEDFLKKYADKTTIDLEIKQVGIERKVREIVNAFNCLDRIIFISFHFETIMNIKKLLPQATVGFLTRTLDDELSTRLKQANINRLNPKANLVTPELVKKWQADGFIIRVWGVYDEAIMKTMVDANVDGMTVDFPDVLLKELGR